MKIVLVVGIIILFGFIGFSISKHYKERKRFFFEFNNFLLTLKTDINFSSKKLEQILETNSWQCQDIKKLISNYRKMLNFNVGISEDELFTGISILNKQERESIFLFFKSLGKVDIYNQIEIIESFNKSCAEYYRLANDECKKYCGLYTKLGIIIGSFVALMII